LEKSAHNSDSGRRDLSTAGEFVGAVQVGLTRQNVRIGAARAYEINVGQFKIWTFGGYSCKAIKVVPLSQSGLALRGKQEHIFSYLRAGPCDLPSFEMRKFRERVLHERRAGQAS
jgi:hypothetical protein